MEKNKRKLLLDEFPPINTEQWEEQIKKDLKGADYDKKLIWKTIEGINVKPYYREENLKNKEYLSSLPGEFPFIRGNKKDNNTWEIRQDFEVKETFSANKNIRNAIERGATAVGIKLCIKDIDTKEKFFEILKDINPENVALHFRGGKGTFKFAEYLLAFVTENKFNINNIKGSFSFDPIGHLTTKGNFYLNEEEDFRVLSEFILKINSSLPGFKIIGVNGSNFANAGSTLVQELAFSLSVGTEYLDKLTNNNLSIDQVAGLFIFTFGQGSNYFMEIAKIRAARLLWSNIINAYKPADKNCSTMFIHCVTNLWNKSLYDPYVNMLRTTTESMSAAIAGADSITVLPFDACYTSETEFSFRIARNSQIILKEEAYFDKIVDPASGSYYIESLTENIAEESWKLFLEIENKGGYIQAFKNGIIQASVEGIAQKRKNFIATRREILLGINQFPNNNETMAGKINKKIAFINDACCDGQINKPLNIFRGSQEFELLRLRTEKHSYKPKVFMLTIGNLNMRKARATFSANFFACAGYEIIDNSGFKTVEEGVKAALEVKADIIVVCSSDDEYTEFAPQTYNFANNKAIIVVAGSPVCMDELKSQGIQYFIHMKSNVLETLQDFHNILGIK